MNLEIIILSEVNEKEKDKYHMISLICGNLKCGTSELSMKQTHRQSTDGGHRRGGAGMAWRSGVSRFRLLCTAYLRHMAAPQKLTQPYFKCSIVFCFEYFFKKIFFIKDNCFTEFCCFLSNLDMNQPQAYIYPLPFVLPSHFLNFCCHMSDCDLLME